MLTKNDCIFEQTGERKITCKVCKTTVRTAIPPSAVQRTCGVVGLGDAVSMLTKAMGIDACQGCLTRQEKMNQYLGIRLS